MGLRPANSPCRRELLIGPAVDAGPEGCEQVVTGEGHFIFWTALAIVLKTLLRCRTPYVARDPVIEGRRREPQHPTSVAN
jgi:hypothetical protein